MGEIHLHIDLENKISTYTDRLASSSVSGWLDACRWSVVHISHTCSCLGCSYDQLSCSPHVATRCYTQ